LLHIFINAYKLRMRPLNVNRSAFVSGQHPLCIKCILTFCTNSHTIPHLKIIDLKPFLQLLWRTLGVMSDPTRRFRWVNPPSDFSQSQSAHLAQIVNTKFHCHSCINLDKCIVYRFSSVILCVNSEPLNLS